MNFTCKCMISHLFLKKLISLPEKIFWDRKLYKALMVSQQTTLRGGGERGDQTNTESTKYNFRYLS